MDRNRPCRDRRVTPAMQLLVLVGLAFGSLPLAGCASSDAVEEPDAIAAPVNVRDMASSLGLTVRPADRHGRVAIQPTWGGDRILVVPEATAVNVRGHRYTAEQAPWRDDGKLWLSGTDAREITRIWQETTPPGRSNRSSTLLSGTTTNPAAIPERRKLPPRLPPRKIAAPAAPAVVSVGAPSAAELRAWAVPLRRDWRYIVIHHSATANGSTQSFHEAHRKNGWDGLGYHFVIGNGRGMRDGAVERGFRWPRQREGAHAGNDTYNQHGIGICLVGDFSKTAPTAKQMKSLKRLCDFLSAYCAVSPQNLRLHRDFRKTACPGKHFPRTFRFTPLQGVKRGVAKRVAAR